MAADGYLYAPDPSSQGASTLGGNIANNAGGPHTLKYGVTANHILALELVLPTGEIVTLGDKTEDVNGYDLLGLALGSEGTFGIVTEATVRLTRASQAVRTLLAIFDTVDDATQTVSAIVAAGIVPAALEMMDAVILQTVEEAFHFGFPLDAGAILIIELDGLAAGIDTQADQVRAHCSAGKAREIRSASTPQDRANLWAARKKSVGTLGRLAPSCVTQDCVIPRSKLPQVLRAIAEIGVRHNLRIANVFHAGDGNLHPVTLFDERNADDVRRVMAASHEILELCISVGGTLTGRTRHRRREARLYAASVPARDIEDDGGHPGRLQPRRPLQSRQNPAVVPWLLLRDPSPSGCSRRMRAALASTLLLVLLLVTGVPAVMADVTLGVASPAVQFSPGNWAGAGRGGTLRRTTWNNGAWCRWRWTTKARTPHATLQISNLTPGSAVSYFLDGVLSDNVPVPPSGGIAVHGLTASGPHTLTVYTRNSPQTRRWSGANAFTITGLTLDAQSMPARALPTRPWVLIVGDSITEGIQADNGDDSSLCDYSFLVGQGLKTAGYDTGVSACGYSGWLRPGDGEGDVPPYYAVSDGVYDDANSRWNKIDAHTSLLDSAGHLSAYGGLGQEPSVILLNYGVNECLSGASLADMSASVQGALAALRDAAPRATLFVLVPPGLAETRIYPTGPAYIASLKSAVLAYRTAHPADTRTVLLDLGPDVARTLGSPANGGGVHPNAAGHAYLAPLVLKALLF